MADHDELGSAEAWEAAARAGEQAVRRAIGNAAIRKMKQKAGPYADLGVAVGALVAVGGMIAVVTKGGDQRVAEEMAMAYLRGALRGDDQPLNADGTLYTGARTDA